MFKRLFNNLLLRYYIRENREVMKIDSAQEFKGHLLKNPVEIIALLKHRMRAQTLLHFEGTTYEQKLMTKGAALFIKALLKSIQIAQEIDGEEISDELKVARWLKKTNLR